MDKKTNRNRFVKKPPEIVFAGCRFLLLLLLAFALAAFVSSCQKPSVSVQTLEELPEHLTAGFNNQRWYFTDLELAPPFIPQKEKNINGLATDFFYAIRQKLILTTFNGYLVSLNRSGLNDVDRMRLARGISVPPAFYRPLVFVSIEKGRYGLQAYDLLHRKVVWKKKGLFSRSSPLVQDQAVFHATLNGKILAYNALSGKQLWTYDCGQPLTADLAAKGDTLVACTPDGLVLALNALDGSLLWRQKLDSHIYASPMILKGKVYLSCLDGCLRALKLTSGRLLFQSVSDGAPIYRACSSDGLSVFAMDSKGRLARFTPQLKRQWQVALTGVPMFTPLVTNRYVLAATMQKYFYVIDKNTGHIEQEEHLKHRVAGLLPTDAHTLFLMMEYHHLARWQSKGALRK